MEILFLIAFLLALMPLIWLQATCEAKLRKHLPEPFLYPSSYGLDVAMCKEKKDEGK